MSQLFDCYSSLYFSSPIDNRDISCNLIIKDEDVFWLNYNASYPQEERGIILQKVFDVVTPSGNIL